MYAIFVLAINTIQLLAMLKPIKKDWGVHVPAFLN
jgi:hypothetical protein